jgi:DNA polymerase III delta prime subunit
MNHNLFINKYQPLYFEDFELDKEIINVLNSFIKINSLNILLIGNIGSGKTTLINAIIREYYKGYNEYDYNSNVLYINNMKEQFINYYRNDVKTFCQTCSTIKNKKKIVILDDMDLINENIQQVFRNCINKYSHNVHFISSCNNIQKVIESIQSRLTIIKINPLERKDLNKIMQKMKFNENIDIDEQAEEFILSICNNSAKVLINYMEKFKLINQKITYELSMNLCTNISFLILNKYSELLKESNYKDAIHLLYSIYEKGYSVMDILDNYFTFIKFTKVFNENEKYEIIPIICKYITIFHNIHEDEIELALFTNNLIDVINKNK